MAMETLQEQNQLASQVPYIPRSNGPRLDTLTPRNMASAVQSALDDLEGRVGDVDEFVAQKLNYPSVEAMHGVLAAEQVDGVALSIDNIERGDGSLIGDQTGVGKGRQMAAMIRYAQATDRTPIFVTRDAGLYADMVRDLDDIGTRDFKPFITNSQEKVPLPDGRTLETKRNRHGAELDRLIQQGGFAATDDYDGVFTTYSQMQTVKGQETPRRQFLDMMAPQSLILFDEAHEAGGSPEPENSWKKAGPPNRADFARRLVDKADGVTFSSATAIKRPDVMDLYGRRSGMRQAAGSIADLQSALEIGGTPLQQVSTNMLAQDGFYNRRERNYEGVDFGIQTVPVDRASTDGLSQIMGKILAFDRTKQDALKGLDDHLKANAKAMGVDNSVGQAGADSTNFTAIMHNVMDQSLLSRKAGQMADEAIASLERGEKPILTVSNTMGSFIEHYAEDNNIAPGDAFEANFGDIMMRYLERSRDVLEKEYDGTKTRRRLSDEELGPDAVQEYEAAKALIVQTDLDFPVSPIDHIKQRVEAAGYEFGEITGRKARLNYDSEGHATYQRRSSRQTSKAGKVRATDRFNGGQSDVLLLNRSGATGISLHASEKFADQRRRHMIVGQAERNVNDFMQTLGRAHRTGQVVPPRISLLMGDTPDEKRPAALLERKMSSLNANTTADKNAGFDTSEIPDFFNQYGDAVVEQVLSEYPEINERLDYPITVNPDGIASLEDATEGAIAKVTGRLPLLSVAEQESFYSLLEDEYTSFVQQQQALGNNILEAEAIDLDARPLAQAEVIPALPGVRSTFGSGVQAEVIDAKAQSKPKTQLEVINEIRTGLDLDPVASPEENDPEAVEQAAQAYTDDLLAKAGQAADHYLAQQQQKIEQRIADPEKRQTNLDRAARRLDKQQTQLTHLRRFQPGQTVRLATDNGRIFYGAVTQLGKRGSSLDKLLSAVEDPAETGANALGDSNPVAPSKWMVNVSLADSSREIPLPLSKINVDRIGAVQLTPVRKTMMGKDVMAQFDERQSGEREVRQVLRGNLLRASDKYGKAGNVVNATLAGGGVEPMLLLPRGYDLQQQLSESPVVLPAPRNVQQFMEISDREGIVKTSDEQITLKAAPNAAGYLLQTGKKQKDVYLDEDLMAAVGDEFYSVSDRMEAHVPPDHLEAVVSYLQGGRQQQLEAVTHLEQARELMGENIPEFTWSDSVEDVIESAGLAPSLDLSNLDAVRDRLESTFAQADEPIEVPEDRDEMPVPAHTDPTEQGRAMSAQDVRYPGQPDPGEEPTPEEQAEEILDEAASMAASSEPDASELTQVGGWTAQRGKPEKHVGKLLEEAGLAAAVMADEDFYLKVENDPFIPLNIERHGEQLMLYHTLVENGDAFIDSEMVFNLSEDGFLDLAETAVHGPRGESRGLDRSYAGMFASNLRKQGFAEAIQQQLAPDAEPEPKPETEAESGPEPESKPEPAVESAPEASAPPADTGRSPVAEPSPSPTAPSDAFADVLGTDEAAAVNPPQVQGLGNEQPPDPPDYQETLSRLREVVQDLPEAQQQGLLAAIDQAATQMNQPDQPPSEATVSAGAFIQAAIAQNDPELDQQLSQGDDSPQAIPTVEQFRDWYRAARSLGRSEEALSDIAAIGQSAKSGDLTELGPAVAERMEADLSTAEQQQALGTEILTHARRFLGNLEAAGLVQRDEQGNLEARGRQYTVRQTRQGMGVVRNDQSAGVLANGAGEITQVANLSETDQQNWAKSAARSPENLQALYQTQRPQRQSAAGPEL